MNRLGTYLMSLYLKYVNPYHRCLIEYPLWSENLLPETKTKGVLNAERLYLLVEGFMIQNTNQFQQMMELKYAQK